MERRQIEYFLAVVDFGGFTAAAQALHVAQPSLSHAIKVMERELDAELFHRLPRGVQLTAAGEAMIDSARRTLRDMETARASVRDVVGLMAGRLDIASLPTLALEPLAGVVGRFRARYPDVRIRLMQSELGAEVRESVRTGAAELGVVDAASQPSEELDSVWLGHQELVVTLPPGTKRPKDGTLSIDQLLSRDLVTGLEGTLVRDMLTREAYERGCLLNVAVEVGHRESALHLVAAGAGSAVLPRPLARIAELEGAVLASLDPILQRKIDLVRRPGTLSPAARAFQEMLLADGWTR
ncbi:LysR family transcriptional regulator [Haloactinomyces albus]|uniref:DNA-binding transcriptional LysR family regulator n=1 Tax=Haloactinomyces albus TaxID=1352928 RepID=A0AAE3ZIP0_9ACTN|nr:LysR family transcriptional regulator [Haloactinomyces albus]MDR7303629.1 DNA-binding transcriptional LysR family regulator [Haloactinomyces albus]